MFGAKFWDNAVFKYLDADDNHDNYDNRCNIKKIVIRSIAVIRWIDIFDDQR